MNAEAPAREGTYFLSVNDVMERTRWSRSWLYKKIRAGEFPEGHMIGSKRRWRLEEFEAWADQQAPRQ